MDMALRIIYINQWLAEMKRNHGERLRVLIVDRFPDDGLPTNDVRLGYLNYFRRSDGDPKDLESLTFEDGFFAFENVAIARSGFDGFCRVLEKGFEFLQRG